ncbi:MAG: porin, partial [Verrucomicrobia bacterium]|nr:porin [Verrucomicrobiota bacterium]
MHASYLALALLAGVTLLQAGTSVSPADKNPAPAQPAETFGGSLLERSKLTGDWGGFRDDLAKHGLTIDLDGLYTFQGVASGDTGHGNSTGNLFFGDVAI